MENERTATRVLVVDDEESQRTALASMVALWGYSVETAADGQEALEKLASFGAHVIVTDLMMPRMDGNELLRRLKAQGGGPPAIVQTAFGNLETAVATNCAALPDTLMESELFGHEKGAFTGALERRAGCFELAQNGTVLLDEIGDMPVGTQAKLLRVLEDGRVRRLGGKTELQLDVRVLASTNSPLDNAIREGKFREDLFYRLNV